MNSIPSPEREKFESHFPKPHSIVIQMHTQSLNKVFETAKIAFENGVD
jgi:hypothetical protein